MLARRLAQRVARPQFARGFAAVGDKFPNVDVDFGFPPSKVNMAERLAGKKRAFSGACTLEQSMPRMAVVLFPGFELLDVAAPGELLGAMPDVVELIYCAQTPGPIASCALGNAGPSMVATGHLADGGRIVTDGDAFRPDAILVPGGQGVRTEVHNEWLLSWLRDAAEHSKSVLTVCTGSWLLGASGALDGIPATSNKAALRQGKPQEAAPGVLWQMEARWVEHEIEREGQKTLFVTASGVSAGGDAALALAARLAGREKARELAHRAEWTWQEDPSVDPFAKEYQLSTGK